MRVTPANAPLGAIIEDLDLSAPLAAEDFSAIRDALHRHSVVAFRDQRLTPQQQVDFCGRFGTLERHILKEYMVPGFEALIRISNILDDGGRPIGEQDAGSVWHSDGAFLERPNLYSMLYALEVPRDATGGSLGATLFVSTAAAFESLPDAVKAKVAGLKAVNSFATIYNSLPEEVRVKREPLKEEQAREFVHPVVRTHPFTGRKCIFVSKVATSRIIGLPAAESRELIEFLSDWCVRDEMMYSHRWQVGDLLVWDNCATQHRATRDYALPQRRLMHRATVGGSLPY